MIAMKPVASSAVRAIGYDPDTRTLRVEYVSGAPYDYADVDPEVYDRLLSSQSVGKDLREAVRGKSYARLER